MSWGKFTEYSDIGKEIQKIMEIVMDGVERRYGVRFKEPRQNISRRLLNEIEEFESEAVQDQEARKSAAKEVKEHADKNGC